MIVHMIGNAHIDPIWLWRWEAGVDEALATFRSAADRCDENPDFIFTRGEAWLYRQVERLDPALFARVRLLVARGQWHLTGGQVIQPDMNMPTAEGLRRQFAHGRRYFLDRFGVCPDVGYNVDSFGHPATLPDLLASLGYLGYVFGRPSTDDMALPANTFIWQGVGGAELLAARIVPLYLTRVDDLESQILAAVAGADPAIGHALCFYGVGNHGGGPTKGNIAYIRDHRRSLPGIELRFSTPSAFFQAVAPCRDHLPVVTADLQGTPPGVYSAMHAIKQEQRRGERLLEQCASVIEQCEAEADQRAALHQRLDAAWEDLLFTQFHDILGGASIPSAWASVRALQGRARLGAEEIALETTRRWARRALPAINEQQIVVCNADDELWLGLIECEPWLDFDQWGDRRLTDIAGQAIPWQRVQPEAPQLTHRILFPARIEPRGHACFLLQDHCSESGPQTETDLGVSESDLHNGRLRVDLGPAGVASVCLDGKRLLGGPGMTLELREDSTDNWSFGARGYREPVIGAFHLEGGWTIEERGPLRARVRSEGYVGRSWVRWTVSLRRGEPCLYIDLEVLYGERGRLLQLNSTLGAAPASWSCGLPGGAMARETGPAEWPMQAWARATTSAGVLAVATDDCYSVSLEDSSWRMTLLRSPRMAHLHGNWGDTMPGGAPRAWHTDQGLHTFAIALHCGPDFSDDQLHSVARQSARPPIVFDRYEGLDRPPWGNDPPAHLR